MRELAERSLVGYDAARYKVSRMISRGDLVVFRAGRPALLALPGAAPAEAQSLHSAMAAWWAVGPAIRSTAPQVSTDL